MKLVLLFAPKSVNFGVPTYFIGRKSVWLGADGENYINGFQSLIREGIFSQDYILQYFSFGYPFYLFLFSIFQSYALIVALVFQVLFFSFSCLIFFVSLLETRLKKYATLIVLGILINPTLTLSSLEVGYESLAASSLLLATGLLLNLSRTSSGNTRQLIFFGNLLGLIVCLNGRFLVSGLLLFGFWLFIKPNKLSPLFPVLSVLIAFSFLPAAVMTRNYFANDGVFLSTNLGETLRIGAGSLSTGGYPSPERPSEPLNCEVKSSNMTPAADKEKIRCVASWYSENVDEIPGLFARKFVFFWSPWYGPLWSGTTNRNMWKYFHPLNVFAKEVSLNSLITGAAGKIISIIWMSFGIFLLALGFMVLFRASGREKSIGILFLTVIIGNTFISMASIGDNRFRIPILPFILTLQVIGILYLFDRRRNRLVGSKKI